MNALCHIVVLITCSIERAWLAAAFSARNCNLAGSIVAGYASTTSEVELTRIQAASCTKQPRPRQ